VSGKNGTGKKGTVKNGTSNNGTGNNGTSGKEGKNGTFLILGFGVGVWNWRFGDGGFSLGVWPKLTSVCYFYLLSICAIITCAILAGPL